MLALLVACTGEVVSNPPAPKALFVGVDGLRGDGLGGSDTPNFDTLVAHGAFTATASTQLEAQTVSGPGWTSMLTGVDADKHGIVENGGWEDIDRAWPTVIARAGELGLGTATAVHWLPIHFSIIEADAADETVAGLDDEITEGMAEFLRDEADIDLFFIALDDVDGAGHSSGFSIDNPEYVAAIETVDAQVGQLLDAINAREDRDQERWIVVMTSDHGGAGTGHGALDEDNRTIPLLVSGDGIDPQELPAEGVSHMDAHPTLLRHLGFQAEAAWDLDGVARP